MSVELSPRGEVHQQILSAAESAMDVAERLSAVAAQALETAKELRIGEGVADLREALDKFNALVGTVSKVMDDIRAGRLRVELTVGDIPIPLTIGLKPTAGHV